MNLYKFVKALLPSLERDDILEDLRVSSNELDNIVLPSYRSAVDYFKFNKPKSKDFSILSNNFYRSLDPHGIRKQDIFIKDILIRLTNVRDNAELVSNEIQKIIDADIVNSDLSAVKALLLRSASDINFITRYSTDLLNYIYYIEEKDRSDSAVDIPQATIKYINKNFKQFTYLLSDTGMSPKEFQKIMAKVPDVILDSNNEASITSMFKEKDIDPMSNSRFVTGFAYSPIYFVRTTIAEWQTQRYKSAKSKKKVLELRLLRLKNMSEGSDDPKLEKEIEYNQSRLDKINKYLSEFESDLE